MYVEFFQADYIEFGTPLSSKYYLGQAEGELYGLSNGKTKFLPENVMYLRPESGIPGLYLTGRYSKTCLERPLKNRQKRS